jgi:hypothetical protein
MIINQKPASNNPSAFDRLVQYMDGTTDLAAPVIIC